jgi:hypothetical protein
MKRLAAFLFVFSSLLLRPAPGQIASQEVKEGFRPLFNGKNLDGWEGDPRLWSVRDGVIVGSTDAAKLKTNSFLITRKSYADFVLRAQVKLRNHNSGIQFRSEALPDWVVRGYQADLADNAWWGSIYEERGKRGVMANGWTGKGEKVVRPKDWNDYEILAHGDLIQLTLNGLVTATIHDSLRLTGIIALQLHAGPPMQVEFRNIRLKTLR